MNAYELDELFPNIAIDILIEQQEEEARKIDELADLFPNVAFDVFFGE
jgi:hypothetical protein